LLANSTMLLDIMRQGNVQAFYLKGIQYHNRENKNI